MKEDKEPTAMPIMRETKDKSKETNKKNEIDRKREGDGKKMN